VRGVRVVDYGDDFVYHGWGYFGSARAEGPERGGLIPDIDVDGDGSADGDCISYLTFSLDHPLSPAAPHWDPEASNSVFYGGVTGFFPDNNGKGGFSELMCNSFETPDGDNITMMSHGTREKHRVYGLWLWKKEDFFNGGDRHRVSIDDKSWIGLHCMRSWVAMDEARFVLQDGGRFYISEYNFGTEECQELFRDSKQGVVFNVCPAETRWAEYDPKAPYHIVFESEKAVYEPRQFDDVRVAGYYIAKHKWSAANVGAKMYAFELHATVHRPKRPSETLDMAEISLLRQGFGAQGGQQAEIPAFYISRCEIPYALWRKVRRWAVSQMWAHPDYPPYMTWRDGDMGSMDLLVEGKENTHGPDEPVTDIKWLDAVTWCNMLSEYEGKTPVYYFTPDFEVVFRRECERRVGGRRWPWFTPRAFVKWDADGYRLPTPAEWRAVSGQWPAAGGQSAWIGENSGGTTHPVGTSEPNEFGLYDTFGNVWEFVWDVGEKYEEEENDNESLRYPGTQYVMGGDFSYPADPWTKSASPYGDDPRTGNYSIGFRVVRSITGEKPPLAVDLKNDPSGAPPVWALDRGHKSKGGTLERLPEGQSLLDMVQIPEGNYVRWDTAKVYTSPFHVAKHEVSYEKWKQVYDWAVAMGYEFNKDGDMGSMDRESDGKTYGPAEPVTDINRFDAMIWCNALSEMEGRTPCYYAGEPAVYKRALEFRRNWTPKDYDNPGYTYGQLPDLDAYVDKFGGTPNPHNLTVDWSTDGYRLPTHAEWTVAYNAAASTQYYWGDEFDYEGKYLWSAENSGGKTHAVGQKLPNAWGLHDMAGNVWEYCWAQGLGGEKQAFHETWNPKGRDQEMRSPFHLIQGGCYHYPGAPETGVGMWRTFRPKCRGFQDRSVNTPYWKGYPPIGLRPVRCERRTHRSSGSEMPDFIQVLDVNLKEAVTPLQGATHRANLQRTGVHYTASLRKRPEVKWAFQTGDAIWAQPVATRGKVYVFSEDGFIYGLDDQSGEELWRYKTVGGPVTDTEDWRKGTIRPPGPTIKDGILYIGDNRGHVYALDIRTGRPKWKTTVRGAGFAPGSPVPVYGAVFVYISSHTGDGGLLALHGETGQVLNVYRNTFYGAWQSFAFAEGKLFMANHVAGSMLDLRGGERRSFGASYWSVTAGSTWLARALEPPISARACPSSTHLSKGIR